jgi:hypothetical protein
MRGSVLTSLIVFASVYLFVFIAGTYYLLKTAARGPQPVEASAAASETRRAAPLSVPEEPIEERLSMDSATVLPVVWFAIIGFGVLMYVLMDGFVLGIGILSLFAKTRRSSIT